MAAFESAVDQTQTMVASLPRDQEGVIGSPTREGRRAQSGGAEAAERQMSRSSSIDRRLDSLFDSPRRGLVGRSIDHMLCHLLCEDARASEPARSLHSLSDHLSPREELALSPSPVISRCVSPCPAEGESVGSVGDWLNAVVRSRDEDSDVESWAVAQEVLDAEDEHISRNTSAEVSIARHAAILPLGRHMPSGSVDDSAALWSPTSSAFTASWLSEDSPMRGRVNEHPESALLQGTLTAMLRRLTTEIIGGDDSPSGRRPARLTDEEIRALPQVRFSSKDRQNCPICLEHFQQGQTLTALSCQHHFHVDCVKGWMQRATQCPLCRHECAAQLQRPSSAPMLSPRAAGVEMLGQ